MAELEKVIKGLDSCIKQGRLGIDNCRELGCPYFENGLRLSCWLDVLQDALELLKEYKRQDGCPCTHCMEWECDEVCEEYKKWKDS